MKVFKKGEHVKFVCPERGVLYAEVLRRRLTKVKVGILGLGKYTWLPAGRLTRVEYNY
jgi:hypothetical protein